HPGHAQQPRHPVDLRGARAALAGLAVPPDGEVGGLGRLQPVDDVEDDLALVHLDGVVDELPVAVVAAPDPELGLVAHRSPSSSFFSAADAEVAPDPAAASASSVPTSSARAAGSSSGVRYFFSSSVSNSASRSSRIG